MKHILTALALFATINVWAQTSKGSWMIGGGAKIQRQSNQSLFIDNNGVLTYSTVHYGIIELSPTVGYFVKDRLMLGLHVQESRSWALTGPKNRWHDFSFGPLARYYFPVAKKISVFPELAYLFSVRKTTYDINGDKQTQQVKSSVIRGGIGVAWFVAPNIGIEGILAYQNTDARNNKIGDKQDIYYSIGIQFYLPAKK